MTIFFKKIIADKIFLVTGGLAILALLFGSVSPSDIDLKTIVSLLSLIIMVSIYEQLGILTYIANLMIAKCASIRMLTLVILLFSFIGSMIFTNDVAILTLVPIIFKISKKVSIPKIPVISLMTVYANLGSAITPIGNPQDIYLASFYHLNFLSFMSLSLPIGLVSLISLFISLLFFPKTKIDSSLGEGDETQAKGSLTLYIVTIFVLLGVLSIIPYLLAFVASLAYAVYIDRRIHQKIDFSIILTFINFFIIVGAISRVPLVHEMILAMTHTKYSVFYSGVRISQIISNVPAAVLLSKFTNHIPALYLGVTVGGLGTLIASLANLLALRQYSLNTTDHTTLKFFYQFTLINIIYLAIFLIVGIVLL